MWKARKVGKSWNNLENSAKGKHYSQNDYIRILMIIFRKFMNHFQCKNEKKNDIFASPPFSITTSYLLHHHLCILLILLFLLYHKCSLYIIYLYCLIKTPTPYGLHNMVWYRKTNTTSTIPTSEVISPSPGTSQ